jgi:hypothetical protein
MKRRHHTGLDAGARPVVESRPGGSPVEGGGLAVVPLQVGRAVGFRLQQRLVVVGLLPLWIVQFFQRHGRTGDEALEGIRVKPAGRTGDDFNRVIQPLAVLGLEKSIPAARGTAFHAFLRLAKEQKYLRQLAGVAAASELVIEDVEAVLPARLQGSGQYQPAAAPVPDKAAQQEITRSARLPAAGFSEN